MARKIIADLDMPAALTYGALHVPISTINRKAKTGALLRSDEGERVLGLAKLVGQVEFMDHGVDGAEAFDSRAWASRWLRQPGPHPEWRLRVSQLLWRIGADTPAWEADDLPGKGAEITG